MAPIAARIKQVAKDENLAAAAADKRVRDFDMEVKARTQSLFGKDIDDPAIYDLVINTARLSIGSHAKTLAALAAHIDSEGALERTKVMRDTAIAALVNAALVAHPKIRDAQMSVNCSAGCALRVRSRTGAAVRTKISLIGVAPNDRRDRIGRGRRARGRPCHLDDPAGCWSPDVPYPSARALNRHLPPCGPPCYLRAIRFSLCNRFAFISSWPLDFIRVISDCAGNTQTGWSGWRSCRPVRPAGDWLC